MFIRLDRVPACDGRTDRRNCCKYYSALHCMQCGRAVKTVRPGVGEISPVSIYGEIYDGKNLRKRCFKSRVKKEKVIDGDRGGNDSMDPSCRPI